MTGLTRFDMAVYTEVSNEDLEAFVSSYGIGSVLSFKGIAEGGENPFTESRALRLEL